MNKLVLMRQIQNPVSGLKQSVKQVQDGERGVMWFNSPGCEKTLEFILLHAP